METTHTTLTTGQQLGAFTVIAITDEKVCLEDRSAAEYRYHSTRKWLKHNSPKLAAIIKRAEG